MTRVLVLDQANGLWGAQRYLLRLVEPLRAHGVELILASPTSLALSQEWVRQGYEYEDLGLPLDRSVRADGAKGRISPNAIGREARAIPQTVRRIRDAATRVGADVIHANGHCVHLEAALAGRAADLPSILHLHEEMPMRFGRSYRAAAVGAADHAVAVSRAVGASVPRAMQSRVTVIPNGVDTDVLLPGAPDEELRRSLGAQVGDVLLLALTRLDPEKRIEDLIDAVVPLRNVAGWHLAIVGETSAWPEYADRVRREGADRLGDRITFAGRRNDVAAMLQSSDVLVHAGVLEGMPLGMIEAGACGRPVVAYGVAGVPEVVTHGVTGLLAAAEDSATLGRHIATLVAEDDTRLRMGMAARTRIRDRHDVSTQAAANAELIERVRHRHGQRKAS